MNIPSLIYLQVNPEDEYREDMPFPDDELVTWCRDMINDNDILYIRANAVQDAIWLIDQGLSGVAKGRLLDHLKGAELPDNPYLAGQFLKNKLAEIDGILSGYNSDDAAMVYIDVRSIMKIIKDIKDHLNL